MKYLFSSVIAVLFLISCQTQTGTVNSNDSISADKHVDTIGQPANPVKAIGLQNGIHCFAYTKNQDTISMQLSLQDSVASGELIYNFYEKDKNKGIFKGFLKGDTLLANYYFSSEGMQSVRQVVFLLKGNIFLSGSGSMKEQGNRMMFSNKKDISFDNNLVLQPVDCGILTIK